MLGYFSLVGLLRVHAVLGDYTAALQVGGWRVVCALSPYCGGWCASWSPVYNDLCLLMFPCACI